MEHLGIKVHELIETLRHFDLDSGGSSHNNWSILYFHKGVFIGFDNYNWVELALTIPNSNWRIGMRDPKCYGNYKPIPEKGSLVYVYELPEVAQQIAMKHVTEAIDIVKEKIKEYRIIKEEHEKKIIEEKENELKAIENAWTETFLDE